MAKNDMSFYWVGQRPSRPMIIDINDSDGKPLNMSTYTAFEVLLIGSDNEEIEINDAALATSNAVNGKFVFRWPVDRSVFENPGDYLLQLVAYGANGTKDMTTAHPIKVKKLGGNK